ncbi:MAG: hypothetical protein AAF441_26035, partial [Pseudomonadota bacterium]
WYPMTQSEYRDMPTYVRVLRFTPLMLWLFPFYLWRRSPRHDGSHFHPGSSLFKAGEKWDVLTSTVWWSGMLALLGWFTYEFGALALLQYYLGPYLIFVAWLDLVTYLHHSDPDVPWYRGADRRTGDQGDAESSVVSGLQDILGTRAGPVGRQFPENR